MAETQGSIEHTYRRQLSDSLSLGLSGHLDYGLADHSLGYELTFGWRWRFGQLDMLVK